MAKEVLGPGGGITTVIHITENSIVTQLNGMVLTFS